MKTSSVFAFLGGVTVGAIAALLLAPEKGSDTRRIIKNYLEKEEKKIMDALGLDECPMCKDNEEDEA